jgi:hypothetical protein
MLHDARKKRRPDDATMLYPSRYDALKRRSVLNIGKVV